MVLGGEGALPNGNYDVRTIDVSYSGGT